MPFDGNAEHLTGISTINVEALRQLRRVVEAAGRRSFLERRRARLHMSVWYEERQRWWGLAAPQIRACAITLAAGDEWFTTRGFERSFYRLPTSGPLIGSAAIEDFFGLSVWNAAWLISRTRSSRRPAPEVIARIDRLIEMAQGAAE